MAYGSGNTPWQDFPSKNTPINAKRLNAIETFIDKLKTRIDNIVSSAGDSNTEIVDARVGSDNTPYQTLKVRLDAENEALGRGIGEVKDDLEYSSKMKFKINKVILVNTNGQGGYSDITDSSLLNRANVSINRQNLNTGIMWGFGFDIDFVNDRFDICLKNDGGNDLEFLLQQTKSPYSWASSNNLNYWVSLSAGKEKIIEVIRDENYPYFMFRFNGSASVYDIKLKSYWLGKSDLDEFSKICLFEDYRLNAEKDIDNLATKKDVSDTVSESEKNTNSYTDKQIRHISKAVNSNTSYIQAAKLGQNIEFVNTEVTFRGVSQNIDSDGCVTLKKESGVSTDQIIMGVYWEYDFITWEELPETIYFDLETIMSQQGGILSAYLLPKVGDYGVNAGQWAPNIGTINLRERCKNSSIASTLLDNGKVYILFGVTQFDADTRTSMEFEYKLRFYTKEMYTCIATDIRDDKISDLKEKLDVATKALLEIVGYGDSLTANGGWTNIIAEKSGLEFHNAGTGGESVNTIIARQGADPMQVNNITVPADTTPVVIARMSDGGIETSNGIKVTPLLQGGSSHVNPCYIGDVEGNLAWTGSAWNDQTGTWIFTRSETGNAVTIDRPTKIKTSFDLKYNNKKNVLLTVFMGYNGWKNANGEWWKLDDLLKYHKMLINNTECKDFVVIGIHKARGTFDIAAYEKMFENEFGRRFISLRQYLAHPVYSDDGITIISSYGLMDAGLDTTDTDLSDIRIGNCPSSLLADGVHFNNHGKTVVGNYIYSRMKELNMFGGSADATIQYIEKYNETDPTVPSWAKEPTKPTYTANDVGAIPAGESADYYVDNELTAGIGRYGLVKLEPSSGFMVLGDTGRLLIQRASSEDIKTRSQSYNPIVPSNLDYAVKCSMTDRTGPAWTDEERLNALLRIGCTVDENGFVKWTKSETTE